MMHSFQNCDLPINLVHPRFGINTLFTNKFDSNLPSALPTTRPATHDRQAKGCTCTPSAVV